MKAYRATWRAGEAQDPKPFYLGRRWFPWPTDSVVAPNHILTGKEVITLEHLQHESWHVYQIRQIGTVRFYWRYVTSKSFRRRIEAEANAVMKQEFPKIVEAGSGLGFREVFA